MAGEKVNRPILLPGEGMDQVGQGGCTVNRSILLPGGVMGSVESGG